MQSQADTSRPRKPPIEPGAKSDAIQLVTAVELSRTLDVSLRTIERWRKRGVGPPWVRIGPRSVRYDPVELTRWLERNRPSRVPA